MNRLPVVVVENYQRSVSRARRGVSIGYSSPRILATTATAATTYTRTGRSPPHIAGRRPHRVVSGSSGWMRCSHNVACDDAVAASHCRVYGKCETLSRVRARPASRYIRNMFAARIPPHFPRKYSYHDLQALIFFRGLYKVNREGSFLTLNNTKWVSWVTYFARQAPCRGLEVIAGEVEQRGGGQLADGPMDHPRQNGFHPLSLPLPPPSPLRPHL